MKHLKKFFSYIKENYNDKKINESRSIWHDFVQNVKYSEMTPEFTNDFIEKISTTEIYHLLVELGLGHYLYNEEHLRKLKEKLEEGLVDDGYTKNEQDIKVIKDCLKRIETLEKNL